MGPCLRKLLTSQEGEEDGRTTEFIVPIAEVSRSAASGSALVITHSHFKFSVIAVGKNPNNAALLLPPSCEEDYSQTRKTGFQYDCKLFTWPPPE